MTTAGPNPLKIFPLFQLSVISDQLSVGSGKWEVGKWEE
ncbi:hypothetical protein MYAER_0730 [Microcystis aeruginosa NIES-2549]|uniref:Uncharacterized protein n=1 Tax=Microcystis aeruginosa NIES-2549 TaxID=1641812 RepID=A0A0F6RJM7_MICAE|nr:hypothetical protein MYAER_0730 [Microcystis aeruginosa NIES-2549]